MDELVKYLKALVMLQVAALEGGEEDATPPALLLSRAGLTSAEIADLLNKKVSAVQKALERARKPKKTPQRRRR
jgi:DNA-directed RNA polymerase specialized sigma24 family protein